MDKDIRKVENMTYDDSRRIFLKYFLAGTAVLAFETSGLGKLGTMVSRVGAAPKVSPYIAQQEPGKGFPQSIASGDPTDSGMMLWTRVDPSLETGFSNIEINSKLIYWMEKPGVKNDPSLKEEIENGKFVMFEVSKTEDFSTVEVSGFSPIWKEYDNIVRVDLDTMLEPNQVYYYRFITKSGLVSNTGKSKTLPSVDSDVHSATIAYISCQDYTNGYFNALRHLADEEIDFFLHLGDYVYESVGDASYQGGLKDRRINLPSGKSKAFTLEDYRTLYQTYRSDHDLQKLHENHSMVAIWDDHEFANDTYYPAVAPDDNQESDPGRRLFANQVWFEYMPARVPYDSSKSFEESIKIYRSVTIGNLATIFMTDERLYRSAHPCGEGQLDRYFTNGCENRNKSNRSMLGFNQRDWFIKELKNTDSTWKIWGNEVQVTQLKLLNRFFNLDAWDGFPYERDVIAQTVMNEGIQNFIALTGDFHTFEASYLQYDYNDSGEKYGVELMVGSVTSSNLREAIRNILQEVPDTSSPIPNGAVSELVRTLQTTLGSLSTLTAELLFKELQNIIKVENPWIELFDSTTHGYALLTLTKSKAICTAYSIDNIEKPQSTKSLLWQCEIPNGEVDIIVNKDNHILEV
ncbi:alkaline phosphatase D family protein [Oceanobacillus salinisoli]|uniref:alkaline phosphatase D family protein n=1 Tax=Oceanobacillus salinisoli TaxID=2678611 RepID=UPI0018CC6087|nr:alkaline phosphatase D family protein [Oceanobacillus salinisoli]